MKIIACPGLASLTLAALLAPPAVAQTRAPHLDLPLLDVPYNTSHGGRAPSMAQSLEITGAFYEVSHLAIQRAWGRRQGLARAAIALFDVFAGVLPFADGIRRRGGSGCSGRWRGRRRGGWRGT